MPTSPASGCQSLPPPAVRRDGELTRLLLVEMARGDRDGGLVRAEVSERPRPFRFKGFAACGRRLAGLWVLALILVYSVYQAEI
jgi:hypothetical protein